jgi:PAS domain S-box-containing protein
MSEEHVEDRAGCATGELEERPLHASHVEDRAGCATGEDRLSNYLEAFLRTPNAILIHDLHGRILAASDKGLDLFGLTREQALRSTVVELSSQRASLEDLQAIWERVLRDGQQVLEWNARFFGRQDTFLSRLTLTPLRWSGEPAIMAVIVDITEERRLQTMLLDSERRYKQLFENSINGFALHEILTDDEGKPTDYRFLDVNPAYSRMTGLSAELAVGKRVRELLPNIEAYWIETFGRVAQMGESIRYTNYAIDLDRHYEVTAFCPEKGQFAVLVADVTEQVTQRAALKKAVSDLEEANADLEELNASLEDMVRERTLDLETANVALRTRMEELERAQDELIRAEKLASIGELVAGIAHEINTPLGVGVTAASFLQSSIEESLRANASLKSDPVFMRLSAKWMDTARIILANLERAARLVKSFKQVSVDRTSDPLRRLRLSEYVDEILVSLNPMVRRSGSVAVSEVPGDLEVLTYPGALSQILINLLTNSLHHAFPGDRTGTMTISAEAQNDRFLLRYRDNGVGIPAEIRHKVFMPFYTTRKESGGSGLGLFIVQNLVSNRLHGTIECREAAGGGTEFVMSFPLSQSEREGDEYGRYPSRKEIP